MMQETLHGYRIAGQDNTVIHNLIITQTHTLTHTYILLRINKEAEREEV